MQGQNMKAEIKSTESFIITIDGIECAPFTKESTWNGLACYRNKHGIIVAVDNDTFVDKPFSNIADSKKPHDGDLEIITCSPCFISTGKIKSLDDWDDS